MCIEHFFYCGSENAHIHLVILLVGDTRVSANGCEHILGAKVYFSSPINLDFTLKFFTIKLKKPHKTPDYWQATWCIPAALW